MDTEKTLLQQIRDKEQEFEKKIETARADAEAVIAAARAEAEDLLCTADKAGKTGAEQVYWNMRGKTALETEALDKAAELDRQIASERGERNIPTAAERIVRYVTME